MIKDKQKIAGRQKRKKKDKEMVLAPPRNKLDRL